jgi:pimeloyl-ACP methyl ester carboxylesterase
MGLLIEKKASFGQVLGFWFKWPKGILWFTLYIIWIVFPYQLGLSLYNFVTRRKSDLGFLSRGVTMAVRYILSDRDMYRCRHYFWLFDKFHAFLVWIFGYPVKYVECVYESKNEHGLWNFEHFKGKWMVDQRDRIPEYGSKEWENYVVVFFVHGGGFCTGGADNFALTHARIISKFNKLIRKSAIQPRRKLIYFCLDYIRAPDHIYSEMRRETEAAFKWLQQTVGVCKIIVMGDSAGGNLAYQLLARSADIPKKNIIATVLLSPWIELSETFPSRDEVKAISKTTDILSIDVLMGTGNLTLFGIDDPSKDEHPWKKNERFSPFWQSDFPVLPKPLVTYSSQEGFGPSIHDWVQRWSKYQKVNALAHPHILHDNILIGILMTFGDFYISTLGRRCLEGIDCIAEHCLEAYKESFSEIEF